MSDLDLGLTKFTDISNKFSFTIQGCTGSPTPSFILRTLELASDVDIESTARRMYDDCPTVKPAWDQLGPITRSVWCEMAAAKLGSGLVATPAPSVAGPKGQASLF